MDDKYNDLQKVKRHFFAMRNGIIADTLRKAGSHFRIIFGLNLPQIVEIASATPHTASLARELWRNTSTRESMLLAPMLFPHDEMTEAEAAAWIDGIPEPEVADVLCHRLLRHLVFAPVLMRRAAGGDTDIQRYTSLRLGLNILRQHPSEVLDVAAKFPEHPLAVQIRDEAEFLGLTKC